MCNTFLGSLGVAHWVHPVYHREQYNTVCIYVFRITIRRCIYIFCCSFRFTAESSFDREQSHTPSLIPEAKYIFVTVPISFLFDFQFFQFYTVNNRMLELRTFNGSFWRNPWSFSSANECSSFRTYSIGPDVIRWFASSRTCDPTFIERLIDHDVHRINVVLLKNGIETFCSWTAFFNKIIKKWHVLWLVRSLHFWSLRWWFHAASFLCFWQESCWAAVQLKISVNWGHVRSFRAWNLSIVKFLPGWFR